MCYKPSHYHTCQGNYGDVYHYLFTLSKAITGNLWYFIQAHMYMYITRELWSLAVDTLAAVIVSNTGT